MKDFILSDHIQVILDAFPMPVFIKDCEGVYRACNGAFEAYLGRTSSEIIGKNVFDLSPKHLAEKYFKMDKELFDHPGIQRYEAKVMFADGKEHNVIFHKQTFFNASKELIGIVGVINDISEQRAAEEFSGQMQTQLFIASKMASLGNLAAGIGHEINNPLTIINGQIQLMRSRLAKLEITDEKIAGQLDAQEKAIKRIVDIIRSMKYYSKGDDSLLEETDIDHAILETNNLVRSLYANKGIDMRTVLSCGGQKVRISRGKFQQVLLNLYSNAHDALVEDGELDSAFIETKTKQYPDHIEILIANNGPEIPGSVRSKIFDSFFSTKEAGKGSGLGLSLSFEMMKSMRGHLELASSDQLSTVFRITIPLG